MRGKQKHTIDAKKRLFVPSKFRDELGTNVVVAKSITGHCVRVYSTENWKKFEDKLGELPEIGASEVLEWLYANSEDAEIDSQGRMALLEDYIEYAGIEKNIISVGVRDHMEIWDEESFESRMQNANVDALRDMLRQRGF